jgi:hypothetical protein
MMMMMILELGEGQKWPSSLLQDIEYTTMLEDEAVYYP